MDKQNYTEDNIYCFFIPLVQDMKYTKKKKKSILV